MPALDSTAKTAVAGQAFAPAYFLYMDIQGDPLRFTTFGTSVTLSGTGDSELNGTYPAFGGQLIEIGDVSNSESGSEALTITLSGIASLDLTLLDEIGNRAKWQGRTCRIWCNIYNESGTTAQGAIFPLYTGYMSSVDITAEPEQQIIQLSVENWLAAFNAASNRSYLNQKDYDANDASAAATIAASNGMRRDTGAGDNAPGSSTGNWATNDGSYGNGYNPQLPTHYQ